MRSFLWALVAVVSLGGAAAAQHISPDEAQKQLDANNEPMKVGDAAARDAAAIADAENGWFKDALKTRDQRLAWWREAHVIRYRRAPGIATGQ